MAVVVQARKNGVPKAATIHLRPIAVPIALHSVPRDTTASLVDAAPPANSPAPILANATILQHKHAVRIQRKHGVAQKA